MNDSPTDPEYVLRGVAGTAFGRSYHLLAPTTVGRSPECDIFLDEAGISRLHARLRPMDYGLEVEDTGSTNGSFLNGQRIGVAIARIGDEVAFDRLRFRVGEVRKPAPGGTAAATPALSRRRWPLIVLVTAAAMVAVVARRWMDAG
jgi:hypothetical protein